MKRILITGSRSITDYHLVHDAILGESGPGDDVVIVHGFADGADSIAHYWAEYFHGLHPEPYPADWEAPCRDTCRPGHRRKNDTQCPAAGVYRNQDMVDLGADVCLAFLMEGAENKGTKDCIARAREAGIPVYEYTQKKEGRMSEAYAPLTVSFPSFDGQPSVSVRADDPTDLAAKLGALEQVFAAAAAADKARRGNNAQQQAPQAGPWGGQAPSNPNVPYQPGVAPQTQTYQQPPQQQQAPQQQGGYPEDPGKDVALAKLGGQVPMCQHGQKVWKNPPSKGWKGFFCPANERGGQCDAVWDNDK